MRFVKLHGAGNDYVLVDGRGQDADWPALARAMSDRHFGIGSDGLLLLMPSEKAPVRMRMFNPDGSEAEMCGNGIRCFAKYVLERQVVAATDGALLVETGAGVLRVEPVWEDGRMTAARVGMGVPRLRPREIPVALPRRKGREQEELVLDYPLEVDGYRLRLAFVSMGNPHAVAFIHDPVEEFPLDRIGPLVERHKVFPRRTNFEIVNMLSGNKLQVRVWERGVGETLACGTGVCAVAVAGWLKGLMRERVELELPGGTLLVEWGGEGEVYLSGPVAEVFEGEWKE